MSEFGKQVAEETSHPPRDLVGEITTEPVADDSIISEVEEEEELAEKRKLGISFWLCVIWIVAIGLAAILAPWLPIEDPNENLIIPGERPPYAPGSEFWFGSDQDARDIFSRVIWGARVSLTVGVTAIFFGMAVGGTMGLLAGYFRGTTDRVVSFLFLVLLSFPALVLAILMTALLNRTLFTISIVIGVLSVAPVGRVARATTISFAEREFVLASRTLGAKNGRIIVRELLPNVVIPMSALALLGIAVAIVAEGGLAFLGLSVEGQQISWGKLIRLGSGSRDLREAPWMSLIPIGILFLTVMSLNFAGDKLRGYFDVRESSL